MRIKIVKVVMLVEVSGSDEDTREKLDSFLEDTENDTDQPFYEGADTLVKAMLKNAKKLGIDMKDKSTPLHDFDISVNFGVVEKP